MSTMSASSFLRYLLLPVRSLTMLVFIVVVSMGLALAHYGGLLGWPLSLLLCTWVFNYAFVTLEAIANGAQEPPVLAIEMLNPVHEWRPVFQLGLIITMTVLLGMLAFYVDRSLAAALAIAYLAALPASTGALAVGTSVWQAVHPEVLWHIARTLGLNYLAIVAVAVGYGLIGWWLLVSEVVSLWPLWAWAVFAWLSVFTLIGGSLYEYREALGHDALDSPERRDSRLQVELERERSRFLDQVHAQARGGNLVGAWESIERELAAHHHPFEYYDWLLERLSGRDDVRLARRLAQDYVGRALGRDNARATLIAQRGLQIDPSFRPRSGAQCLRVAELLRLAGDRQSAQSLLQDFATHFPGDPAIADADSVLSALKRQ
jgi:hypothetical protein